MIRDKVYDNNGNKAVLARVPAEAESVLDVGCGAGSNARRLRESKTDRVIIGLTGSAKEATEANKYCDAVRVCDLENGLPELPRSDFDVVICSHVLEHLCFPKTLLSDIAALRPLTLIVALPNLMYYKYRTRLLIGRFDYESDGTMDDTHFRWYTFCTAKQLLLANGFRILEATSNSSIPLPIIRKFLPRGLASNLDRLGGRLSHGLFGYELLFVATPEA